MLRINKKLWADAGGQQPHAWLNKQVQVRGWLIWRKLSDSQLQREFKQGVLNLTHPHMLAFARPNKG